MVSGGSIVHSELGDEWIVLKQFGRTESCMFFAVASRVKMSFSPQCMVLEEV